MINPDIRDYSLISGLHCIANSSGESVFHWKIPLWIFTSAFSSCCSAQSSRAVEYPQPNECPRYDTKQSDGEVPVMLGLWGMQTTPLLSLLPGLIHGSNRTKMRIHVILGLWWMWSTLSLPLLPCPLWPRMVALDRALSIG